MSPSERVVQLYPQPPGSLFNASYYSKGYRRKKKGGKAILVRVGGGIPARLYTENFSMM
jgi:hypothetical protein